LERLNWDILKISTFLANFTKAFLDENRKHFYSMIEKIAAEEDSTMRVSNMACHYEGIGSQGISK